MVMVTLDNWRVMEGLTVLHWLSDPLSKGDMQVIILQGTDIDHWKKNSEVLVVKEKMCYGSPFTSIFATCSLWTGQ